MTEIAFKRGVISPLGAIQESWRHVGPQYWLLVGIALVGLLLGSVAPLALLLGPMMCGIYVCMRDRMKGRQVRFEGLFTGFEGSMLVPSIVATLIVMAVTLALVMLFMVGCVIVLLIMGTLSAAALSNESSGSAPPVAGFVSLLILGGAEKLRNIDQPDATPGEHTTCSPGFFLPFVGGHVRLRTGSRRRRRGRSARIQMSEG
jgi:hypothetical protein